MEGPKGGENEEEVPDESGYGCEANEDIYFPSRISFASS